MLPYVCYTFKPTSPKLTHKSSSSSAVLSRKNGPSQSTNGPSLPDEFGGTSSNSHFDPPNSFGRASARRRVLSPPGSACRSLPLGVCFALRGLKTRPSTCPADSPTLDGSVGAGAYPGGVPLLQPGTDIRLSDSDEAQTPVHEPVP